MLFVVHCIDKPGHADVRTANRQAHLDHLRAQGDGVVLAGPLLAEDGGGMAGSLLVLDFADRAATETFLRDDPYARAGLFESVALHPFRQVLPEG